MEKSEVLGLRRHSLSAFPAASSRGTASNSTSVPLTLSSGVGFRIGPVGCESYGVADSGESLHLTKSPDRSGGGRKRRPGSSTQSPTLKTQPKI